jgi:sugar phosphate permease
MENNRGISMEDNTNKQGWFSCLLSALFFFYTISQLTIFNTISAPLSLSFNLSTSELTTMSSVYLYANALWLLPGGILLDRFPAKHLIIFFMTLCVCAAFGFGFSNSVTLNIILRAIEGMASAMSLLACLRFAHDWFANKASSVIGYVVSIGLLGGVFSNLVFPHLVAMLGWRATVLINAIIGLLFLALIVIFTRAPKSTIQYKKQHSYFASAKKILFELKVVLTHIENWKCGCYIGLMNLPIFVLAALWGNLFLTQYKGFSESSAGLLISLIFIGELVGAPIMGLISNKLQKKKIIMLLGAIASLVIMLLIIFISQKYYLANCLLFLMLGFSISPQILGYPLIAENNAHELASTATGLGSLLSNITGACMQIIFGIILVAKVINSGDTQYTTHSILLAAAILPAAFVASAFIAVMLKEKHAQ